MIRTGPSSCAGCPSSTRRSTIPSSLNASPLHRLRVETPSWKGAPSSVNNSPSYGLTVHGTQMLQSMSCLTALANEQRQPGWQVPAIWRSPEQRRSHEHFLVAIPKPGAHFVN